MKNELAITFEDTSLDLGENRLSFEIDLEPTFSIEESSVATIPSSVFLSDSGLRGIVRFLHDEKKLSFNEIASSLNKHINTIRTSYEKSKPLGNISGKLLPVTIFAERPPLEAASVYLADEGYRLKEIAGILGRNSKTVWTTLHRARWKQ